MQTDWRNAAFDRFEQCYETSVGTARIVVRNDNDRFPAYIKPLGNRLGPHVLASEWVGTSLAEWFGLPTLDYGIMNVEENDEIWLGGGRKASPGPAFISEYMPGHVWGGSAEELQVLVNPEDVSRLVVFDTWTLNFDRCAPVGMNRNPHYDNVYLAEVEGEPEHMRLMVMDHTHCFVGGRDLSPNVAGIDRVKDDRVYGLFAEFKPWLSREQIEVAVRDLRKFGKDVAQSIVLGIPTEWEVRNETAGALADLVAQRATFLGENMLTILGPYLSSMQPELDLN